MSENGPSALFVFPVVNSKSIPAGNNISPSSASAQYVGTIPFVPKSDSGSNTTSAIYSAVVLPKLLPAGNPISPITSSHSTMSAPIIASPVKTMGGDNCPTLLPSTLEGGIVLPSPAGGTTTFFLMRWLDVDCGLTIYRTWVVSGAPDPNGVQYLGTKCGATPITNAVVAATWQD